MLKLRSEVSTAPVLLLIVTFVLSEIVIAPVKVMSLSTLIWALLVIAFDSLENVSTSTRSIVGDAVGDAVAVGTVEGNVVGRGLG